MTPDTDPFGHVNNTVFVAYLEQARVDLLFHLAALSGVSTMGDGMVVARHEIDYLRPVRYRHRPLRIETWCSRLAGASFTLDYEVYDAPETPDEPSPAGPVRPADPGGLAGPGPQGQEGQSGHDRHDGHGGHDGHDGHGGHGGHGDVAGCGRGRLAARARSLMVPYDLAAARPRRLTPEEREFVQRFTEENP